MRMKSVLVLALSLVLQVHSQVSDKIIAVHTSEAIEGRPLTIEAELVGTVRISQVLLAYRPYGSSEYRQTEMEVIGNVAKATIPASDVRAREMEYYFIVRIEGRTAEETYPAENPQDRPFRLQVGAKSPRDDEIIFLSPEEGTEVSTSDLLVSISLYRAPSIVRRSAAKLYINDRDVTQFAMMTEDLITLVPENISPPLAPGAQQVRIELYDTSGNLYHTKSMRYRQVNPADLTRPQPILTYNASATLETRGENIQNTSTPYNRANLTASSQYDVFRLNGRLYVTNEEKDNRQPQNRYFIEAQAPWVRLGYGDAYPTFPSLIMTGKRIRGLTANLALGGFHLDFVQGEVVRKVDGDTIRTLHRDSVAGQTGTVGVYDTNDVSRYYAVYRYGTFKRNLMAVRPSFVSENVQFGISLLRSKDDVGSLRRGGVVYGVNPQENIAAGADLLVAFDNRRFEFTSQAGASVYNRNIAAGNITDAEIDSLFKVWPTYPDSAANVQNRKDLKFMRDKFSRFITVNQYLVPLLFNKIEAFIAYEGALSLNYFNNYFKAGYIFRGKEYNSFGQTFIRKDIKGFNIFDRVRLMENQLFLSLGFEQLRDNTDNSKQTTTFYTTLNTSVSYFPRLDFPSITVGYGMNRNNNGISTSPDSSLAAINDITSRIYLHVGYSFTAGLSHNATLSISFADRNDKTRRNADSKSATVTAAAATTWDIPLETSASITLNLNDVPELPQPRDPADSVRHGLKSFNYTTLMLGGRYRLLQDQLRCWASIAPTFGEIQRTVVELGGEYFFYRNLSGFLQLTALRYPGDTDFVWSLMLKYNL